TTDHAALRETDITVLALQTPAREDGSIDLSALEAGMRDVGEALAGKDDYHLVAVKSTVIPGTITERLEPILEDASGKTAGEGFDSAVNPEFQSQGSAVGDFMQPDKLVFGVDTGRALERLHELYGPLVEANEDEVPVVETGRRE